MRKADLGRQLDHVRAVISRELEAERNLFGVVEVHIHDGRLVRTKVSKTEKIP